MPGKPDMELGTAINHLRELVYQQNESIYDVALDTLRYALSQPDEQVDEMYRAGLFDSSTFLSIKDIKPFKRKSRYDIINEGA